MTARETILQETKNLIAAPSVCREAKEAGEAYLAAVGTPAEAEARLALFRELEEDLESIDDLLGFCHSPLPEKLFGKEAAKKFLAHAEELKAAGAAFCDCPACRAAAAILALRDEML